MSEPITEATCTVGVLRREPEGDRPLTGDEMCDLTNQAMEHLLEDDRIADPVLLGRSDIGEIEITFRLLSTHVAPEIYVEVVDIVHDMGKTLGAEWRNSPEVDTRKRKATTRQATTLLRQNSQHVHDVLEPAAV